MYCVLSSLEKHSKTEGVKEVVMRSDVGTSVCCEEKKVGLRSTGRRQARQITTEIDNKNGWERREKSDNLAEATGVEEGNDLKEIPLSFRPQLLLTLH